MSIRTWEQILVKLMTVPKLRRCLSYTRTSPNALAIVIWVFVTGR